MSCRESGHLCPGYCLSICKAEQPNGEIEITQARTDWDGITILTYKGTFYTAILPSSRKSYKFWAASGFCQSNPGTYMIQSQDCWYCTPVTVAVTPWIVSDKRWTRKKKRGKCYTLPVFGLQLQITFPFKWKPSTNTKHTYLSAQWIDARVGGDRARWKNLSQYFWILSLNYSQLGKAADFSSQHQPTAVLGY